MSSVEFKSTTTKTGLGAVFRTAELIFHTAAHDIRSGHHNAVFAILVNILRSLIMVGIFYLMFSLLGIRGMAVRGDFLLYIMSGIFLYMTHIQAVSAVNAGNPMNPMLLHSPLNTTIVILGKLLSVLYMQFISAGTILLVYHLLINPIEMMNPFGVVGMLLLAFFTGVGAGLVFLALTPYSPKFVPLLMQLYIRANMIASGKMFVANALPAKMIMMFSWNPLFHCIDQARGFMFINYFPRVTSWEYALIVGIVLLIIGMLAEFHTRQHASASWGAKN